ncbi:MAG: CusA/CzcA family heavy metal efflux RND transporter [Crocinitomicaceae bacterium]
MLNKIIFFSIKNKFVIGLFTLALIVWGVFSATKLPIDALPDITNNQVQILTTSPTLSTQEVERFITFPIERSVKSIPQITELRSVSRFGLSIVTVVFEEDVDIYWARTQINERLKAAEENIPSTFGKPVLAPVSTGLGEIFQYCIEPAKGYEDQYSLQDLRTMQDWLIAPQILGTKGVAEVNTLGGLLKEYEVAVNPDKLKSMNVTMADIFQALTVNNENTGGAYIDKKPNAYFIRGIGMINSLEEIQKIVVKVENDIPKLMRDVADIRYGDAVRYGATTKDGKGEVVSGMVMMLKGENSAEVVTLVKEKIMEIESTLPKGVEIVSFLDRSKLVDRAIATVEKNLVEGALIVIFILVLLIGNWRAGLIVASVIPLALLFAISMMRLFGVSGNLMSLGAIDFGLIVDGAVIIVEAIVHRIYSKKKATAYTQSEMDDNVYEAASKIRTSAAFGEIIILIVYLPILVLVGIEGKMFIPMAQTVSFAIAGAFILSLTYVPMMSALVLKKTSTHKATFSDKMIAVLNGLYQKLLHGALQLKGLIIGFTLLLFIGSIWLFSQLGGEFIPTLDEGDIATHIIIPPGSSLQQEIETTTKAQKLLMDNFPEIEQTVAKIGSAEVPTDPMPMEVADVMVILKDKSEWTSASNQAELAMKMEHVLDQLPGVTTEFSQPIQMRFNELMTGVRSDVGVKIFGEDLGVLESYGNQALEMIVDIEGVQDARLETVSGLPQIEVTYNKDKLALYGLNVNDLNQLIQMGFAGTKAGVIYEGEKRFDLVVRLESEKRNDISDLKNLYVSLPNGNQIPLHQVAEIELVNGPAQVSREEGKRRIIIGFNVRERDVQSVVEEIQSKIKTTLDLPEGYYIKYAGQFENLVAANERLSVAVPIALALIFVLLYFTFRNFGQSLLIFTAIPLSAIGGVLALWMRGMPFSISAGVGFIALFGVAVLNGIVLIGYFNQLKEEGITDVLNRIKEGTKVRLRPVLMTAGVASLGFLPMALSTSAGAEVQKPLATVVIGGLVSATFLTLIVLPILYYYLEKTKWTMKQNSKIGALILCIAFSNIGLAQNPTLTLESAIEMGLENSYAIKDAQLNVKLSEDNKGTAFSLPKTNISASFGQVNTAAFDQFYGINQGINPFLIIAKKQLVNSKFVNSQLQLVKQQQVLKFEVREAWTELLYLLELEKLLKSEDELYKSFAKKATLKFKAGEASNIEKLTAEQWQITFAQQVYLVQKQILNQKIIIGSLIGLDSYFFVETPMFEWLTWQFEDDSALYDHPDLQLIINSQTLAEDEKKVASANLLPEIQVGYFIQSMRGFQDVEGTPILYDGSPQFQGFSVGLSLPIFSSSERAVSKMAKTNMAMAENNAELKKFELAQQFKALVLEQGYLKEQLELYQNSILPMGKMIQTKATKSYTNGDIDYVEYGKAIENSIKQSIQYLELVKQNNQKVFAIQYLLNQ